MEEKSTWEICQFLNSGKINGNFSQFEGFNGKNQHGRFATARNRIAGR